MKHIYLISLISGVLFSEVLFAQQIILKPEKIQLPESFTTTIPLRDMEIVPPTEKVDWKNGIIPNNDLTPAQRNKTGKTPPVYGPDPVLQKSYTPASPSTKAMIQNFEGIGNLCNCAPPDTDGDVGPDHYIQMVNSAFQIFDKSGTALTSPASLNTIWTNLPGPWVGTSDGDPIVLYDEISDRWLLTQFSLPNYPNGPFYELLAVSATSDPLGSYHLYAFSFTDMPDYPKLGVWPDGYYMSINKFSSGSLNWAGAGAVVFERDQMLNGNAAQMVFFSFTASQDPWSFLPADVDGAVPPIGTPNYFVYLEDVFSTGTDRLRIHELSVDWVNPANSTFTGPVDLNTAAFNPNVSGIPQPGSTQTLDPLSSRLMYRLQYRNFGTHQTLVTNHTVNAGSGAGIRWYELRNTGSGWSIYQQGTYAPLDGNRRWMGSLAMNGNGDIAIGYSISGGIAPSIRYTGRFSSDPPGTMTLPETTIISGSGAQSGTNRWGDYSAMSVDPADDLTFWYTQEYVNPGGNFAWRTRIGTFEILPLPLTADFESNVMTVVAGNPVTFTDKSLASPTTWEWTFEGGTPGSYSGQTPPPITYSADGFFDVTLKVGKGSEYHTTTKTNFIHVSNCSYCTSEYTNTSDDWISNVTFNTINNSSGSVGYEDFTSMVTNVKKNGTYNLSVSINVVGSWVQHCFAFFDWNQDCDFNDAGESFDLGQVTGSGSLSANITVPSGSLLGITQMRIAERWNVNPGPCDNLSYGEVEDYSINVTGGLQEFELTALLEGSYNGTGMNTSLSSWVPLDQPYDGLPWEYPGTENVVSLPNGTVVDWVLVELREALTPAEANAASQMERQAAFILDDGRVVALDGSSNIQLDNTTSKNIYAVMWHRNHLPVMSAKALLPAGGKYIYDFTDRADKVYGGLDAHKNLAEGTWGMIAGDGDHSGTIDAGDKSTLWENETGSAGYINTDYNLDGQSNNIDKDEYWLPNTGKGTQVPE